MLKDLANQAQVCRWQPVAGDIGTLKADERMMHGVFVMLNQLWNHVDADVAHTCRFLNPSSNVKVATAQIDDTPHLVLLDKLDHGGAILFGNRTA
jgi:hypothetical protein